MPLLIVNLILSLVVLVFLCYFVVVKIDSKNRMTKWELFMFLVSIVSMCFFVGMNTGEILNRIF